MRLWIAVSLLGVALAGCTGEAPTNSEDDTFSDFDGDLKATKDTGIIKGLVIDRLIVPVVGANVSIDELAKATVTDEQGRFGFSGLPGGFYTLTVSKPTFQTVTVQANVVPGENDPPTLKVQMDLEPSTLPRTEPLYLQGHIGCSVTTPSVSAAACDLVGPIKELTNNEFILFHTFDRPADWVQSEMSWKSSQALGDSMSLSWTDPSSGAQVTINSTAGTSPVMIGFDREVFETMNLTGKQLWLRVFSTQREGTDVVPEEAAHGAWASTGYGVYNGTGQKGTVDDAFDRNVFGLRTQSPLQEDCIKYPILFDSCLRVGGVGATIQQDYEVFTTMFYNFKPNPGWMFVIDGDHPVPEP